MGYYTNTNPDLLARADITAQTVLEIGCGAGAFARDYLRRNPMAHYVGVEYVEEEAKAAKPHIPHVVCANIEETASFVQIDRALNGRKVDLLIIGDVLEHLIDPYKVMARLRKRMAPNGRAEICIPNIAHYSILMRLLQGDWTYGDNGLLDRTHLRFFTRKTMQDMFDQAGWHTRGVTPRIFNREKGMKHARAFARLADDLGFDANVAAGNMLPLQWIFSLSPTPQPRPRSATAVGIGSHIDALSTIRVKQPLAALYSAGHVAPHITVGKFADIPDGDPGIFYTYRLHPQPGETRERIDQKCKDGWLFIHDVDDHPAYLNGQKRNDFWSIRAAHAVTVTTPALAQVCRQWNENVFVVPNQIYECSAREVALAPPAEKPTVFFGAINRSVDWKTQCREVVPWLRQNADLVRCKFIHDSTVAMTLGDGVECEYLDTLPYADYIPNLAACDIALLPLIQTAFSVCKSDLKIIECMAHGVVPIVSSFGADQTDVPRDLLYVAETPADWARHLRVLTHDMAALAEAKNRAYDHVRKHRMWAGNVGALGALFDDLWGKHAELEQARLKRM